MHLLNLHSTLICDKKDFIFARVQRYVGMQGNTVVDLAARHALEKRVSMRLAVSYSDFKVLTSMYTKCCCKRNEKDIQRTSCVRFNPKWIILFRLMVDVAVRKLYYADCVLVTQF